jgi:uncharacterized membrane protein
MRLWIVPVACLAAGLLLGVGMVALDGAIGYSVIPHGVTGGPSAAQTLLSTILTSLVTLISVVLTVMTVAIQLAMGQFSPRIVTALLRDRSNQVSFGLFGGTCVYTAVAITAIDDQSGRVPGLTVLLGYVLAIASLGVLILYVDRAGQRLRASGLIDLVGDQLHVEIEQRFAVSQPPAAATDVVPAPRAGIVTAIDHEALVALASRAGCRLTLQVRMGDFVAGGAPLLRVSGGDAPGMAGAACHVRLGDERTHDLDPAYGFRKLVDIAARSASDDPTTTVEALHRIHDCMRQLAPRAFPSGHHADAGGTLRLVEPVRDWDDYVLLAFEEIRLAAPGSPQIARRLRAALLDLASIAPTDRRPPLEAQLELLDAAVRRHLDDDRDVRAALVADAQGLG